MNKYFIVMTLILASAGALCSESLVSSNIEGRPVQVVASFSVLADLANEVGGDLVEVYSLVGWDEDSHVFHPSPRAVRRLTSAELLLINGLGLEGWVERLISAAGYSGHLLVASSGVSLIEINEEEHHHHHHDEKVLYDPHAWHSLIAAKQYVVNIMQALQEVDPENEQIYHDNAQHYLQRLDALDLSIKVRVNKLEGEKHIVMPHNAFEYLARDYGFKIHSLQGLSTESEASAAQIVSVVRQIKRHNIKAIFTENVVNGRLIEIVTKETGVALGGALISGALSREAAPTYIDMFKYNVDVMIKALSQ